MVVHIQICFVWSFPNFLFFFKRCSCVFVFALIVVFVLFSECALENTFSSKNFENGQGKGACHLLLLGVLVLLCFQQTFQYAYRTLQSYLSEIHKVNIYVNLHLHFIYIDIDMFSVMLLFIALGCGSSAVSAYFCFFINLISNSLLL